MGDAVEDALAGEGPARLVAGRYSLGALLGRGAMGTVWLASDNVLCRDVAVKEITFPPYLTDEERRLLRERTLREARAAARFEHPKVTTVHDVVEEDGKPWIVMEHVRSRNLIEVVRQQGALPVEQVARIGLDLLEALQAAHRAGILHRDVKPANVLLDEQGQAWLTDFGIATSSDDSSITGEGMLLGSPSYMSPERAKGEEPGRAADFWSLGATLYTAVEGRPPFEKGEPLATLVSVMNEDPAPFRAAGPLEPVLRSLLQKDPAARPDAPHARAALRAVVVGRSRMPEQVAERSAPAASVAPDERVVPAVPVVPAAPDQASAARGNLVTRIALEEVAAFAASTAGATRVARSAARGAARGAVPTRFRPAAKASVPAAAHAEVPAAEVPAPVQARVQPPVQRPAQAPVQDPASAHGLAQPAMPAPSRAPSTGAARPAPIRRARRNPPVEPRRPIREKQRRRFRKRWVAIPLAALLLVFLTVIAILLLLVRAILSI